MSITTDQIQYIKDHYPTTSTRKIADHLELPFNIIQNYANNHGIRKSKTLLYPESRLCQEHESLILQNYETGDFDDLSLKTGMSKHAISEWARKRGLERKIEVKRIGTLEPLMSGTLESYYWLGFIAADGYIHKDGHLMVSQCEKYKDIIYRLADYLKTNVYIRNNIYRVNVCDKIIGVSIRKMFGVQDQLSKTYTGISLDFIKNSDQANAFLCGLIDGDGNLTNNKCYRIQCHTSWENTFKSLLNLCNTKVYSISITHAPSKQNPYLHIYIKKDSSNALREFVKVNSIPCSHQKFF